jgi:hypothetical protein
MSSPNRVMRILSELSVSRIDTSVPNVTSDQSSEPMVTASWIPTQTVVFLPRSTTETAPPSPGQSYTTAMVWITLPRVLPEPTLDSRLGPTKHILFSALVQALYFSGVETGSMDFRVIIRGSNLWTAEDRSKAEKCYGIMLTSAAVSQGCTEKEPINWDNLEVELWKVSLGDLSIDEQLLELRKLYQRSALAEECLTFQNIIKCRSEKGYGTALPIGSVKAGEGLKYMRRQVHKNCSS